jgi:hypothetical protein
MSSTKNPAVLALSPALKMGRGDSYLVHLYQLSVILSIPQRLYRSVADVPRSTRAILDPMMTTVCLGADTFNRHFALADIFGYNRQGGRHDVATYKFV